MMPWTLSESVQIFEINQETAIAEMAYTVLEMHPSLEEYILYFQGNNIVIIIK